MRETLNLVHDLTERGVFLRTLGELGVSRSTLYRELRKHREGATAEPVGRNG